MGECSPFTLNQLNSWTIWQKALMLFHRSALRCTVCWAIMELILSTVAATQRRADGEALVLRLLFRLGQPADSSASA
jgi:hypothetical protein